MRLKIDPAARDEVRRQIRGAFGELPAAAEAKEMLLPGYASSEDAEEMAAAFAGRRWPDIPIQELFYHREMLGTLNWLIDGGRGLASGRARRAGPRWPGGWRRRSGGWRRRPAARRRAVEAGE